MIAHTLSIVKNADQILVVADGTIKESGTHEELLAEKDVYKRQVRHCPLYHEGQRILIRHEPHPRTEKAGDPAGRHAPLCPHHPGGLAVYQGRHALSLIHI